MSYPRMAVLPLRALLVTLFVALLAAQVVALPARVASWAEQSPDVAELRWPLVAVLVLGLACVQVVIACTWNLLTMVRDDRIFTRASLRWVDAIIWAVAAAFVLLLTVFVAATWRLDLPGLPLFLLLVLLAEAVFGMLMLVLRALLVQATTLRSDMDAVI